MVGGRVGVAGVVQHGVDGMVEGEMQVGQRRRGERSGEHYYNQGLKIKLGSRALGVAWLALKSLGTHLPADLGVTHSQSHPQASLSNMGILPIGTVTLSFFLPTADRHPLGRCPRPLSLMPRALTHRVR
jgi:hypothetical protein